MNQVTSNLNIPFFLVGAMARDFLLEKLHEISTFRATVDYDLGVQLESWESFVMLKSALIKTGCLTETREYHRLLYKNSKNVDLIPFGRIGGRKKVLKWPPTGDVEMNIAGFEAAYESAVYIVIQNNPRIEIKVVSLPGLAALKIFSWNDRSYEKTTDAADLAVILRSYSDAGNSDRIYENRMELLKQRDYDYVSAGAGLLGEDIKRILKNGSLKKVLAILKNEIGVKDKYRLIEDMIRSGVISGQDFAGMLNLLEEMTRGIEKPVPIPG